MKKNLRLQLAHMLKLYKEVAVEDGILCTEAEEFVVGDEMFLIVDGEAVPAHDGEYKAGEVVYVVAEGKLVEIKEEKVAEPEPDPEPTPDPEPEPEPAADPEPEPTPDPEPTPEPAEDSEEVKALKEENEALKAKVEELEAKVQELTEKLKEYEEKEKETEPSAEDAEKFSKQKEDKYAKVMTRMSYLKK